MPKIITKKSSINSLNSETKKIENLEVNSSQPTESLADYLTNLERRWNNHLTGLTKQTCYENQEAIITELIPFLEQALEPTNNLLPWTTDLLTKWTTDYTQWKDDSNDLITLQELLTNNASNPLYDLIINKKITKEDLEDQAIELEIKVNQLEKDLKKAYQANLQKTKEWANLAKQSSKQLKSAVRAKAREYKSFINPNNKEILTKHAKEKLGMLTQEEMEETINKFKLPLQEWENTFVGKSAQQVQDELTTSKEKAFKSHLERRAMEIDRDNYKEDVERMVKEVASYYEEYKRFLDLLSKERDRTTALEDQIYSLGAEPIPEEEEEENNSNQEDNTSEVNSLNEQAEEQTAHVEVVSD